MLIMRMVKLRDLDDLYQLATRAPIGLTTLQADKKTLLNAIKESRASITASTTTLENGHYVFVMEDTKTHRVAGISAIQANIGQHSPFYTFKCAHITRMSYDLKIRNQYQLLNLVNDYEGSSELCTLYLDPAYRKHGNGLLLSLSRLLFIACFPARFHERIIAECRGVNTERGQSPFWQSVGRHFFKMEFAEADKLSAITNKQFIADLMPRHPIYVNLLSKAAQNVIGKPHAETQAAYHMLHEQGFRYQEYVDIFDAGPIIEAHRDTLKVVSLSQMARIEIAKLKDPQMALIGRAVLDFRAMIAAAEWRADEILRISPVTARRLQVKAGDKVRFVPWPIGDH